MTDFLSDFDNSLQKLDRLKDNIATRFRDQDDFSNEILQQLTEINTKIKELSGKINELKEDIIDLQKQIDSIDSFINGLRQENMSLHREIDQLQNEKTALLSNNEQTRMEQNALQSQINDYEERIATLNTEKTTAQSEIESLKSTNESLTQQYSTDQDERARQFAQEMGEQQEAHIRQLRENQEAFNEEMKILMSKVEEVELKINELESEKQARESEMIRITSEMESKEDDIKNRSNRIIELERMNEELMNRIITATNVINQSIEALDNLTKEIPNVKTQTDIRNLFSQINESIDSINVLLQRSQPGITARGPPERPSLSRSGAESVVSSIEVEPEEQATTTTRRISPGSFLISPNTEFTVSNGNKLTLNQIKQAISEKIEQMRRNNTDNSEFTKKLQKISNLNSKTELQNLISTIDFTENNTIKGGKTTRKYKKHNVISKTKKGIQKGGFVWNTHSKRKTITTPTFSRKSSSRNSTSRRSSTNSSSRKRIKKNKNSSRR